MASLHTIIKLSHTQEVLKSENSRPGTPGLCYAALRFFHVGFIFGFNVMSGCVAMLLCPEVDNGLVF